MGEGTGMDDPESENGMLGCRQLGLLWHHVATEMIMSPSASYFGVVQSQLGQLYSKVKSEGTGPASFLETLPL